MDTRRQRTMKQELEAPRIIMWYLYGDPLDTRSRFPYAQTVTLFFFLSIFFLCLSLFAAYTARVLPRIWYVSSQVLLILKSPFSCLFFHRSDLAIFSIHCWPRLFSARPISQPLRLLSRSCRLAEELYLVFIACSERMLCRAAKYSPVQFFIRHAMRP